MAEIGNGSTKAISVILSNGDANNFIFGAYTFSEETKQVRVWNKRDNNIWIIKDIYIIHVLSNMIFKKPFPVVLLAFFSIVLAIFIGLVCLRFHRYRRKKAQGQWPITDEIFSKVERIGFGLTLKQKKIEKNHTKHTVLRHILCSTSLIWCNHMV